MEFEYIVAYWDDVIRRCQVLAAIARLDRRSLNSNCHLLDISHARGQGVGGMPRTASLESSPEPRLHHQVDSASSHRASFFHHPTAGICPFPAAGNSRAYPTQALTINQDRR